jgi:purine-binding chemotaxis protein CheW
MGLTLFIHKEASENGRILQDAILRHFTAPDPEVINTFSEFKTKLKSISSYSCEEIIIVLIDRKNRLTKLISMIDILKGKRLVLILPDESKETRSQALRFFPRFFTQINESYDDLCDILKKMMKRNKKITNGERREQNMAYGNVETSQTINATAIKAGKYLTFFLEDEEYGIGIIKVKEIIGIMPVTTIPRTPEYVKGVINLRGKVIPIVDLRIRFGMPSREYNQKTCIIVVEIDSGAGIVLIGIVVDAVSEVLNIKEKDIEDTPEFGTQLNTDYILGMAKMEGGVKILLNIDRALSQEEVAQLNKIS